ncbi:MAG: cyclopropane-fatty-acyl-phospholipid synthase [Pseudonocardiales bacterium]|nr:cyclopropane-fatty-acyl-phospholipid synthase [Pseudonocardiales bacterium]
MPRKPLATVLHSALGDAPIAIRAYDGSVAGPADATAAIELRSPKALSYLLTAPGSLGMARAYVSGELDVDGDVYEVLSALWSDNIAEITWQDRVHTLLNLDPRALRWVEPPESEIGARRVLNGLRHSKARDAEAIHHHYDVSNQFYEYVLGPSMAYTCACYPTDDATLEEAQFHKFDLVCRKLGLKPGMRLLDVGCGWGGMVRHAVEHYGVTALGVTLSRRQAEWAAKAIADQGLDGRAEVRFQDYRDVEETDFDAVSSIGLTEHIGYKSLPSYFSFLYDKLRPQGRLLNHCITRPTTTEGVKSKGFIDRYVFPDGELEAVGTITSRMQDTGFEVRHVENLREHYAKTLHGWGDNLEANWDACVAEVGIERARVWRLYMAGSRLGFDRRGIELHQVLGVKVSADGSAGVPLRPDWGV